MTTVIVENDESPPLGKGVEEVLRDSEEAR
jgi:hypothetical protein